MFGQLVRGGGYKGDYRSEGGFTLVNFGRAYSRGMHPDEQRSRLNTDSDIWFKRLRDIRRAFICR